MQITFPKTTSRILTTLTWLATAALTAILGVVLHELGHFLMALLMGFDGLSFHYEWVSYANEDLITGRIMAGDLAGAVGFYPLWQIVLVSAAGPLTTLVLQAGGLLALLRRPGPFFASLALTANLRAIPLLISTLLQPGFTGADEDLIGHVLGLPPALLALPGALLFVGGSWVILRRLPKGGRLIPAVMMILGAFAGLIVYLGFLGPSLLP